MTVHHLNCATMHPFGSRGDRLLPARLVAHCLLVERPQGLLLVDTGFGTADLADPARLGRPFRALVGPALDPAEPAVAQLGSLGFAAADVTDVVLTGGMNGRQLADEVVRRRPSVKVLYITGYTRNAIIHHGRLDPDIDLLTKPFTADALARKLRRILDGG